MCAPIFSPIADIDISAPSVNNPIPIIKKIAPTKNVAIMSDGSGTRVKERNSTINEIGNIDDRASLIFDFIFSFTLTLLICKYEYF